MSCCDTSMAMPFQVGGFSSTQRVQMTATPSIGGRDAVVGEVLALTPGLAADWQARGWCVFVE